MTHVTDGNFQFDRRYESVDCKKCGQAISVATNNLLRVKYDQTGRLKCKKCGALHHLLWGYGVELKPGLTEPTCERLSLPPYDDN